MIIILIINIQYYYQTSIIANYRTWWTQFLGTKRRSPTLSSTCTKARTLSLPQHTSKGALNLVSAQSRGMHAWSSHGLHGLHTLDRYNPSRIQSTQCTTHFLFASSSGESRSLYPGQDLMPSSLRWSGWASAHVLCTHTHTHIEAEQSQHDETQPQPQQHESPPFPLLLMIMASSHVP